MKNTSYFASTSAWLILTAIVTLGTTAHAQDGWSAGNHDSATAMVPTLEETPIADGRSARVWLQQQGARKQASTVRQTLSGPVMAKVHDRYVDSFNRAVPDHLRDETPISNGTK
jgi:hypothetical protein